MFGKIVAISTIKHLSRNYASFQQPSVQEWYSLSTSGQAQSIPQRNTADFHGDGCILQNTGHEAEEISFVVCDVNSEYTGIQVTFERNRPRLVFILSLYKSHFFQHPSWMEQLIYLRPNYKQQIYHINKITSQLK